MRPVYRYCAMLCLVTTLFPAAAHAQSLAAPPPAPPAANDSTANGIGIGVAIGAAAGFGLMQWAYNSCKRGCEAPEPLPMYLSAMGMGAGVGAVTGWLIDRLHKGKPAAAKQKAISLAPIVGRNTRAMMVNIRY